jgi:protein TonB
LFGSVLLHVGLLALFLFAHPPAAPSPPPPYMVHLLAAPAGERMLGTLQPSPAAPPTPAPAAPKPLPAKTRPAAPTPRAKTAPKLASKLPSTPPAKQASKPAPDAGPQAKPSEQPQAAGGGPTGGRGNDVANIDTPGIEFDYPWYVNAIARGVITRFNAGNSTLVAEVRFVIKRDGSVDPESIRIVTSSRNYSFDQRALAAIEAAANAHAFPPLPGGFREDILPVTFRFSPSSYR